MTKRDIQVLTREIQQLIAARDDASFVIAHLVAYAKRHAWPRSEDWVNWTKDAFGFSRRHAFMLAGCALYLEQIQSVAPALVLEFDVTKLVGRARDLVRHVALKPGFPVSDLYKLDVLRPIPPQKLKQFLQRVDIAVFERDELRAAVNDFLGRKAVSTLVAYGRLPAPGQLLLGLDEPGAADRIDYGMELQFVQAHMKRLSIVLDRAPREDLVKLRSDLADDLRTLDQVIVTQKPTST
jgi:hypothetical protein